jgi:hypothetical protein
VFTRSTPTIWSSAGKEVLSRSTGADQVTPPSVERDAAMLRPLALPSRQTTYAEDEALVAPGRKAGVEACTKLGETAVATVAAADQVRPPSSEYAALMVTEPTFGKSVQVSRIRPVLGLTAIHSLSAEWPVTKVEVTSRGADQLLPSAFDTLTDMPCTRSEGLT